MGLHNVRNVLKFLEQKLEQLKCQQKRGATKYVAKRRLVDRSTKPEELMRLNTPTGSKRWPSQRNLLPQGKAQTLGPWLCDAGTVIRPPLVLRQIDDTLYVDEKDHIKHLRIKK